MRAFLKRLGLTVAASLALGACVQAQEARTAVARFSSAAPGAGLPGGWQPWPVDPRKPPTRYSLVAESGRTVLRAEANASVSALTFPVKGGGARLQWRWRIEKLIAGADERQRERDDAPVRVLVAFDGDLSRLSAEERAQYALAAALSGRDPPYATLMYIWSNAGARESVSVNPRSSRARALVVEQGARRVGRWIEYRRDLGADYRKAFGEDPGAILWVGVMTDADDTGGSAVAWYGDLVLLQ
jgi:hypothetical protein